jgi:hypothetical protein
MINYLLMNILLMIITLSIGLTVLIFIIYRIGSRWTVIGSILSFILCLTSVFAWSKYYTLIRDYYYEAYASKDFFNSLPPAKYSEMTQNLQVLEITTIASTLIFALLGTLFLYKNHLKTSGKTKEFSIT